MARFDVARVGASVWKWLCRCPDAIGPVEDSSSEDEFFTPPTTPGRFTDEQRVDNSKRPESALTSTAGAVPKLLSPAQTSRLRRRHAEVVRQLVTPSPIVPTPPQGPLKPYQRPIKVYRPVWAP
jgi:hypothetical protein